MTWASTRAGGFAGALREASVLPSAWPPAVPHVAPLTVRTVPTPRVLWLFGLSMAVALVLLPDTPGLWLWPCLLAAVTAWDARPLRRRPPAVGRLVEPRLVLGEANPVTVVVENRAGRTLSVSVRDEVPAELHVSAQTLSATLAPGARASLAYDVVPMRRGRHDFGALYLRARSRLGLCDVIAVFPLASAVRVYPNLRAIHRYALAARTGVLERARLRRRVQAFGSGELDHLREYVVGDSYRDVDWKATAKRRRPILRVYGEERAQTVIIALDAGRMMASRLGEVTKLDHAIQACLLLTFVALQAGDSVGVLVFAADVESYVPPMSGMAQYKRVLESLFDVQPRVTYVDHGRLTEFVRRRVPKRALLLLFSDMLDASQAAPMVTELARLGRQHLPVCVSMEDGALAAMAERQPDTEAQAYARAAAADLAGERAKVRADMRSAGIGLVEAPVGELALAAVDRYLDIKARREL